MFEFSIRERVPLVLIVTTDRPKTQKACCHSAKHTGWSRKTLGRDSRSLCPRRLRGLHRWLQRPAGGTEDVALMPFKDHRAAHPVFAQRSRTAEDPLRKF